jgi:hypothetical protein
MIGFRATSTRWRGCHAHEYEFGEGEHGLLAFAARLFPHQAGMLTFRAFAAGKQPDLNYSWDGDKCGSTEAMKNLAMSRRGRKLLGCPAPMAGSNDKATRTEIFQWIEKNEKILLLAPICHASCRRVLPPKSRDYDPGGFRHHIAARGDALQAPWPQVITPIYRFISYRFRCSNVTVLTDAGSIA